MVGLDGSGNSSTFRPLGRRYSVIPSTEVTRSTPAGNAEALRAGPAGVVVAANDGIASNIAARISDVAQNATDNRVIHPPFGMDRHRPRSIDVVKTLADRIIAWAVHTQDTESALEDCRENSATS